MYDRELDDLANMVTDGVLTEQQAREIVFKSATESSDSDPHVHTVADAKTWWSECFPQHTKGNDNA